MQYFQGTYAVPRGYGESGKADGALGSSSSQATSSNIGLTKKSHYQGREPLAGSDDILDDEEESMDWWTKYFASVDAMIEVSFFISVRPCF